MRKIEIEIIPSEGNLDFMGSVATLVYISADERPNHGSRTGISIHAFTENYRLENSALMAS